MSYRIEKAKKLFNKIKILEEQLDLNTEALSSVTAANGSQSSIDEFSTKISRLEKKLLNAQRKWERYADDNLKISDLSEVYKSH